MKKLISVLAVVLVIFQLPLIVSASDTKLYTNNVSAKSNRLFDVYIDVKSPKIISAATFTLSYNTSAAAFRTARSNISGAEVKSADNNGKVKVIILIPNGVKVNKKSSLLSLRFKALQAGSSEIKISPSDFVDVNAKNFKDPSPVKSKVITDGKSTPIKRAKSRRAGKTAAARTSGKSVEGDADIPEGDADAADGLSPEDGGLMSAFDSTVNGDNPNLPIIILVAVCAVLTAAGLILILKKTKDDKNDKDK